jgi:hypothetical protein
MHWLWNGTSGGQHNSRSSVAILIFVCAWPGCAAPLSPKWIEASPRYTSEALRETGDPIQRGKERPIIDTVGWVLGIPSKIILWNRHIDSHRIDAETELAIREYLAINELDTVRVRLNQYRPGEDWSRLRKNTSVAAPWRYTIGALSVLGETIIPGRLFGGDHYNPFTDTIHLYSNVPSVALHEGAHAKDFARRKYKGTYAFAYLLPVVPLYHESVASRDVVAYLESVGTPEEQAAAAKILYPAYGTYVSSAIGTFVPGYTDPIFIASVLGGHAAGRWEANRILKAQPALSVSTNHQLEYETSSSDGP